MLHREWADAATLSSAVDWLLSQCGRTQTECRQTCMQLVFSLSPHLPGLSMCAACWRSVHLTEQTKLSHMIQIVLRMLSCWPVVGLISCIRCVLTSSACVLESSGLTCIKRHFSSLEAVLARWLLYHQSLVWKEVCLQ